MRNTLQRKIVEHDKQLRNIRNTEFTTTEMPITRHNSLSGILGAGATHLSADAATWAETNKAVDLGGIGDIAAMQDDIGQLEEDVAALQGRTFVPSPPFPMRPIALIRPLGIWFNWMKTIRINCCGVGQCPPIVSREGMCRYMPISISIKMRNRSCWIKLNLLINTWGKALPTSIIGMGK